MGRFLIYVAGCLAVASSAVADTVVLKNGKRMENVIAEVGDSGVTVRFSYGEMSLPASMVVRVEEADTALDRYLSASAVLLSDPTAEAVDWLDLALEARADGLHDGYRRALLRSASLDPMLPSLASHLQALDYVLDGARGRWVPYQESSEALARAASQDARRRAETMAQAERQRAARRGELVERLELALLARAVEDLAERQPQPRVSPGIPLWSTGGPYVPTLVRPVHGVAPGWPDTEANRATLRELTRRQPGSLLPVAPRRPAVPPSHRTSFKSPSRD